MQCAPQRRQRRRSFDARGEGETAVKQQSMEKRRPRPHHSRLRWPQRRRAGAVPSVWRAPLGRGLLAAAVAAAATGHCLRVGKGCQRPPTGGSEFGNDHVGCCGLESFLLGPPHLHLRLLPRRRRRSVCRQSQGEASRTGSSAHFVQLPPFARNPLLCCCWWKEEGRWVLGARRAAGGM